MFYADYLLELYNKLADVDILKYVNNSDTLCYAFISKALYNVEKFIVCIFLN